MTSRLELIYALMNKCPLVTFRMIMGQIEVEVQGILFLVDSQLTPQNFEAIHVTN